MQEFKDDIENKELRMGLSLDFDEQYYMRYGEVIGHTSLLPLPQDEYENNVLYGGEFKIKNQRLKNWNDRSGHYLNLCFVDTQRKYGDFMDRMENNRQRKFEIGAGLGFEKAKYVDRLIDAGNKKKKCCIMAYQGVNNQYDNYLENKMYPNENQYGDPQSLTPQYIHCPVY